MNAKELMQVWAALHKNDPDDRPLSIGRWETDESAMAFLRQYGTGDPKNPLQEFCAEIALTVGDIRRMAKE